MTDQINTANGEELPVSMDQKTQNDSGNHDGGTNSTNTLPSGKSEGKSGKITADDKKRFLSNIVVNKGLEEAAEKIAKKMKDIEGGIQVARVFPTAVDDFLLLDLRKRISLLDSLLEDLKDRCNSAGDFERIKINLGYMRLNQTDKILTIDKPGSEKGWGENLVTAEDYTRIGGDLTAGLGLLTGTLSVVGDIIGYFRSDYSIKGQSVEALDQFTIEAAVAGQLVNLNKEVFWVDVWQMQQSPLYQAYSQMVEKLLQLQQCTEKIKTNTLNLLENRITRLTEEINSLKTQLLNYINVPDQPQIEALQMEIKHISDDLHAARKHHIPDSYDVMLQSYLTALYTKRSEEILKTDGDARKNLETEIGKIIQSLEQDLKNPPDKKLSEVQKKALNDQLVIYQKSLAEVIKNQGNNQLSALKEEITTIQKLFLNKPDGTLNDAEINFMETKLKTCMEKLTSWQSGTETVVKRRLEEKITAIKQDMVIDEKEYGKIKTLIAEFDLLKHAADEFITLVTTIQPDTGISPLSRACLHEYDFGERVQYLLKVNLVAADADVFEEDPSIFVRFPNISYLGGAVVDYVLLTKTGKVVSSGSVSAVSVLDHKVGREPKKSTICLNGKPI